MCGGEGIRSVRGWESVRGCVEVRGWGSVRLKLCGVVAETENVFMTADGGCEGSDRES